MKEYKKSMVTESSDEDDNEDEVKIVTVHDKNVDPDESREKRTGVIVPNMLPIPVFMVVALMKAYTSDAANLCLAAIEVIKERAVKVGDDPITSLRSRNATYVVVWLWNVARNKTEQPHGVRIGPVANPQADEWSRDCHLRHLAERVIGRPDTPAPMQTPKFGRT